MELINSSIEEYYYGCTGKTKEEDVDAYSEFISKSYLELLKIASISLYAPYTKTMHVFKNDGVGRLVMNYEDSETKKEKESLLSIVKESNELLRSMHSIVLREGKDTNWEAFSLQLLKNLTEQHRILYIQN